MVHLEEVQLDTIPSPSPLSSSSFLLYYRGNTTSVSCNYWYRLLDRLGQRPGEPSIGDEVAVQDPQLTLTPERSASGLGVDGSEARESRQNLGGPLW